MLKSSLRRRIHEKLRTLIEEGAGPGFQLALGYKDQTLGCFEAGLADFEQKRRILPSTLFDLASLTKILATVHLLMRAFQEKRIQSLDQKLLTWFPFLGSELKERSLREVLNHQAGLSAVFEYSQEMGADLPTRDDRVRFFLRRVDETYLPLTEKKTLYSDLGFMLLGLVLEQIYGKRLSLIFGEGRELKFGPLRASSNLLSWLIHASFVAGTLSLDSKPRFLRGLVQDPRAQWLHGDAGHAGIFGSARGLEAWGLELYRGYHGKSVVWSDKVLRAWISFEEKQGSYVNGFDSPASDGTSQAGKYFGPATVGHLGYTGTSLWMDMERGWRICLLTHRFQPGIDIEVLRKKRPEFHDWICSEVFSKLKT